MNYEFDIQSILGCAVVLTHIQLRFCKLNFIHVDMNPAIKKIAEGVKKLMLTISDYVLHGKRKPSRYSRYTKLVPLTIKILKILENWKVSLYIYSYFRCGEAIVTPVFDEFAIAIIRQKSPL